MLTEVVHHWNGWRIRTTKRDELTSFFAEAIHDQHARYEWASATNLYDVLSRLADKIHGNREEILRLFGIEP